jgi:hypothetical protein
MSLFNGKKQKEKNNPPGISGLAASEKRYVTERILEDVGTKKEQIITGMKKMIDDELSKLGSMKNRPRPCHILIPLQVIMADEKKR